MANQMALNYGKRYMNKKLNLGRDSTVDDSGDAYKYVVSVNKRGKKTLKKKDEHYFHHELGIPKQDARILAKVMSRARLLDGRRVGPIRLGVSAAVQLIPELGDVIDGLLSMSLVKTASKVSGGLDNGYRNRMVRNVVIEVAIGLIPLLGDFIDTFYQANTRNVVLLEAMLTARVQKLQDAEKAGTGTGIAPTREGTRTTRHHNDNSRTATPPNYDDRHAGMHKRLQTKEHQDPARSTHASEADGGNRWLNRFQSRGKSTAGSEDGAPARPPRPAQSNVVYDRMSDEDLAPARPPRHGTSRHHPVGSF